jgi:hypothetical protein
MCEYHDACMHLEVHEEVTEEMPQRMLCQLRKAAQAAACMAMSCSGSACAHWF